ncbi:MAG TPA: hypothetical protein VNG90_03460 [Candidatus Acidoferrum sp.]|nr:hypothetical protein [Candidatus Acidoferrum sp.]
MNDYPEHLYDPTRIEAAAEISADILSRLSPGIQAVDSAKVRKWWDGTFTGTMDAWNQVYALSYSMRLTAVLDFWTAANCSVAKQRIPTDSLSFFSVPGMVASFALQNPRSATQARAYVHSDRRVRDALEEALRNLPGGHESCLLVRRHGAGFGIDYGNYRVLNALIGPENKDVDAYVCNPSPEALRDFWVPAETLLRLVRVAKQDESALSWTREALRWYFARSRAARITWDRRIAPDNQAIAQQMTQGL